MDRRLGTIGAVAAALSVAAGAFGAHALRDRLPPDDLAVFDVAVRWHALHALAVVAVSLAARGPRGAFRAAGFAFLGGLLLFSGSLYALALGAPRWAGAITPVGGVLFLAGWALTAVGFARAPDPSADANPAG
jgi:uncharacterized membrane protein YgdD (TMEM256/DUF423 family)